MFGSFYVEEKVQGSSFDPPKKYKSTEQAFSGNRNLRGSVRKSGRLDYSELPKTLLRDVKGEYFAVVNKECKIFDSLANLDDHGCPKFEILLSPNK